MRHLSGLNQLLKKPFEAFNKTELAELLKIDLLDCRLSIYGQNQGLEVVITEMKPVEDGLNYDSFDQRLDIHFAGELLHSDVPLTYALQGKEILITGRCSVIAQVCGADLLLNQSFIDSIVGGQVRQKFCIPIKQLGRYR